MSRSLPPGIEIRPATSEEMEDFGFVAGLALAEHDSLERESDDWFQPDWSMCVFDHGTLVTTLGAWPMTMRFNGTATNVAAVSALGTLPTRRGRGYVREALARLAANQYENGQSLAVAFATQAGIFPKFGAAICSTRASYEVDPRDLRLMQHPQPKGNLVVVDAKTIFRERNVLQELYTSFAGPRNGPMHRDSHSWYRQALADPAHHSEGPVRCLLYQEGETPLGYALYTSGEHLPFEHVSAGQRVHRTRIREYVWLNAEAYVAMWQYFTRNPLVWRIQVADAPEDDPIVHFARDPRALRRQTRDGVLARVVDIEKALSTRPYRSNGEVTLRVHDPFCDWNDDTWTVSASPMGSEVSRTKKSPQLSMNIHSVAQLATGHLSASFLARLGRIEVDDQKGLANADEMFATEHRMHLMDQF